MCVLIIIIIPTSGRRWHENVPITGCKRNRTILDKNMATKRALRKGWMDKQYNKRIKRALRRPKSGNTHRFTQNNVKKIRTGKCQAMMEYIDFGSRNSLPFTTDQQEKWTDINKAHMYHNRWPKEISHWSRRNHSREPAPNNYRPIPMMWQILTAHYYSLTSRRLLPEEQKVCCKGSRTTEKLSWSKVPKRYISRRCIITVTTQKLHSQIQTY